MTIFIDKNGFIQTTLYTKPGKLVQYLLPSSCHPGHITKNIPFSLAYRLLRIESIQENLLKNLDILKADLLTRNYSLKCIEDAFMKVLVMNRRSSLVKKVKSTCDRIPLVIPYHESLPKISSILNKHWRILCNKYPEAKTFMPNPPMVCYTRDKNLREILVRAKLPPPVKHQPPRQSRNGFVKCGKRGDCGLCSHSQNESSLKLFFNGTDSIDLPIKSKITCTDTNVIYCIKCTKPNGECPKVKPMYIGETSKMAKTRCSGHLSSIRLESQENTALPVGQHFRLPGHSHSDMMLTPFEKIVSSDPFVRKARESFYIRKFNTLKSGESQIQHGLNLQA